MSREMFHLKWSKFQENISNAFNELRVNNYFSDVTLVCNDGEMQAHKIILSTSSNFFHGVLSHLQHPHPVIYLRGVQSANLASVLDFIYNGEVFVAEDDLPSFIVLAEDLKIKVFTVEHTGTSQSPLPTNHTEANISILQLDENSLAAMEKIDPGTQLHTKLPKNPELITLDNNNEEMFDNDEDFEQENMEPTVEKHLPEVRRSSTVQNTVFQELLVNSRSRRSGKLISYRECDDDSEEEEEDGNTSNVSTNEENLEETSWPMDNNNDPKCLLVSNDRANLVSVQCRICMKITRLNDLRMHTQKKHSIAITDYRKMFLGEPQLLERILHRCAICGNLLLLDTDSIKSHLRCHNMKLKQYSQNYMVNTKKPIGSDLSGQCPVATEQVFLCLCGQDYHNKEDLAKHYNVCHEDKKAVSGGDRNIGENPE